MNKPKILIIDDEPDIAETLAYILESNNYDVVIALDGLNGLTKSVNEKPDIILLDIVMPMIDGFNVCNLLKRGEKTKSLPVIMITAKGDTESITNAYKVGAVDYILKPFDISLLISKIEKHLKRI